MKKIILNILMGICILVMIVSLSYLIKYYYDSNKSEKNIDDLRSMIPVEPDSPSEDNKKKEEKKIEMVDIDGVKIQKKFEKIYKKNKDFIGWIKIEDTNVDYPVMFTPNDSERGEYYIHRDFEKEYSAAGVPFVDRNCKILDPTDNIIIYAHNMKSGKMFYDIIKYEDQEFYERHKSFRFDTIYEDGVYDVVAAFYGEILEKDSNAFKYYEFVNAGSEEEFTNYVKQIKSMSIIDTDVDIEYGDKFITLSTCAYHTENGRFAVIAKKRKE